MLGILFKAKAKPGKLEELTAFLTRDGEFCRDKEPNTLRFEFYPDPNDSNALYVYEAYRDRKAFEEHKNNPPFKEWSSGLKNELCTSTKDLINGDAIWSSAD